MNTQTDSTTVQMVSIFYCMHVYTKKNKKNNWKPDRFFGCTYSKTKSFETEHVIRG